MSENLTLKEKIQIYIKNRKEITLSKLLTLSLLICFWILYFKRDNLKFIASQN